ncbi:isochorismate synthase [Streptosporangium subroseum]|uniref:isochorismate synthase n=1 Tax=Streptosporangium subroseum TaxID=106412 RepID=A0A239MXA1_9ACTN|nr:isochorismate synthase DhbC [Streptosporangium subroseum]SNT46489.1 isochorismate synthase [Streptosporangium subroseum]
MSSHNTLTLTRTPDLLREYEPGTFFFTSPTRTLLARGVHLEVPDSGAKSLHGRVSSALRDAEESGHPHPVAVGAIPFREDRPARLLVPAAVCWTSPRTGASSVPEQVTRASTKLGAVPDSGDYVRGVEMALAKLTTGELKKIVLARALDITMGAPIDVRQVLRNLVRRDPQAYGYAVNLPSVTGTARTLLGASPELLFSRSGRRITTNPLAGSAPRHPDPVVDQTLARDLLSSDKDLREHALVVENIVEALRPYCRDLSVPAGPSLLSTASMWHLSTRITGVLDDPEITSLEMATMLHPTPAVCGTPAGAAREAIAEIEPFDRGLYAGLVGWCDAAGDGEWVVTIRCAEVADQTLRLFAGAGIVAGSVPEAELAETTAKFQTMLRAVGLD